MTNQQVCLVFLDFDMLLLWYCYGIVLVLFWYCYDASVMLLTYLAANKAEIVEMRTAVATKLGMLDNASKKPQKAPAMEMAYDQVVKDRQICLPDGLIEFFVDQAIEVHIAGGTNNEIKAKLDVSFVFA